MTTATAAPLGRTRLRIRHQTALLALAGALLAGCGSTVQDPRLSANGGLDATSGSGSPGGDGLGTGTTGAAGTSAGTGSTPALSRTKVSSPDSAIGAGPGAKGGRGSEVTSGQRAAAIFAPLKVGIVYSDNGKANAALGVGTSNALTADKAVKAFVNGINKRGGLAGRRIEAVYHAIDATSSDYSTEASAACASFTQDAHVAVVLDYALPIRYGLSSCLSKASIPELSLIGADEVQTKALPLFASPGNMTIDRRYRAVLRGLSGTKYVGSENRVGVLLEDCPNLRAVFDRSVKPAMDALKLQLASKQTIGCTTGFSSAGPAASAIQSAVLAFRSARVDRILIVSDYEQVVLELFAPQAESQGYRPGYMLSSQAQTSVMRPNLPSGQWPQLHGVGYARGVDIDDPRTPLPNVDTQCLALLRVGGATATGWQDTYVATAVCNPFLLLEQALRRSNGDAHGRAVAQAIASLDTSFVAAGTVDGRTRFGQGRTDGPDNAAPFSFVPDCSCLRYTGSAVRVP